MQDFRNLKVWKAALALTVDVYRDTQQFPDVERYGLLPQVRRASISIGANIAEGCGRDSDADFAGFPRISLGSANGSTPVSSWPLSRVTLIRGSCPDVKRRSAK